MNKQSFFNNDKSTLTVMVQADNPTRIKELMDKAIPSGAEAFGIQFEQMLPEYRKPEVYRDLFSYAKGRPSYVTNYRSVQNDGKSDEELGDELVELAECGAQLCDVMGDYFNKQPDEVAVDENAINKQKELINRIHEKGARVLMSSHVMKHTPAERVLEIALEHQRRGADISKIVVGADNMEQEIENLRIINMLKEKLDIPFLFLSGGECKILRRIGGEIGSCMYLCVYEYDSFATPVQPLLSDVKLIRYLLNK
ncbi:MAG: type I 3-dehydroquinate dehydratase [Acutalibacteraceae bacterium]|nr:type I 3-dehydroquinate dehydratase [Acutalibacteraceae bacterium]